MFLGLVTLLVALTISAVSAYYSIIGLTAIFAAAFWPIVIMGGALEAGKIVATLWLHYYWDHADSVKLKLYLVPAVCVLMFVTSMGVFGFLSKSHADQTLVSGDVTSQVQIFDEKIKTQKDNIESSRKALTQMDAAVDQVMGRTNDENGALKSTNIRRSQAKERSRLQNDIESAQKSIVKLQEERAPIAAQVRKVDAEVGPIKYIAALIYGDNPNQNLLESAVRWVIIIIVSVFDPLAIVLMLAAVASIDWAKEEREKNRLIKIQRKKEEKELAEIELEQNVRSMEELANTKLSDLEKRLAEIMAAPPPPAVIVPTVAEEPQTTPPEIQTILNEHMSELYDSEPVILEPAPTLEEKLQAFNFDAPVMPEVPSQQSWAEALDNDSAAQPDNIMVTGAAILDELDPTHVQTETMAVLNTENWNESFPDVVVENTLDTAPLEENDLGETVSFPKSYVATGELSVAASPAATFQASPKLIEIPAATIDPLRAKADAENGHETKSGFGTTFPSSPGKGDTFIRIDYLPSKLFKWNGIVWIEVEKSVSESYTFNDQYISYLVQQLADGVYEVEDLSNAEQEQIENYLIRVQKA